ncbi:MAG TPA: hypothetical protein VIM70_20485 [Clostridium sp.]|uniref:hypothetical protein n=1 Tax=Clostridium sp. TaxID=1506 RepID=UPI002F95DB9E
MSWNQEMQKIYNEVHRVIYDVDTKEVIALVDNLDKEFIGDIINKHNEELDLAFRNGIKEGREITKVIYKS